MSAAIHTITITTGQLARITGGELVETMSDQQMVVLLIDEQFYDQTPGRNGAHLIPVGGHLHDQLRTAGHCEWVPAHGPYVFDIYVKETQ